jgi:ubiquitin-protein ligase
MIDCPQVLSMLTDPNIDSPANIDAAVSPRAICC